MSSISAYLAPKGLEQLHHDVDAFARDFEIAAPILSFLVRENEPILGFVPPELNSLGGTLSNLDGIKTFLEDVSKIEAFFQRKYLDWLNGHYFGRVKGPRTS